MVESSRKNIKAYHKERASPVQEKPTNLIYKNGLVPSERLREAKKKQNVQNLDLRDHIIQDGRRSMQ